MKRLLVIIIRLVIFSSLFAQIPDSLKYQSLAPDDFRTRYQCEYSAILIDVREPSEVKKKIKGAVIIPSRSNLDFAADTLDKEKPIYIYCDSGIRSQGVAIFFFDKGFRKLYSLEGGIVAWRKQGFKVVRGEAKKKK